MFGFLNLTSTAPGLETFENTTDSYTFVPDALAANDTHYPFNLDVLVTNTGNFGHTFTIASQSNVTLSPANFTSYFQQHAPLASVTLAGAPAPRSGPISPSRDPESIRYICEVPGHFAAGMTGFLYVGVPVPPQPGPPSTAIVESWVLVGSAALLGVGLFAAILSAYMGRFPDAPKDPSEHH